MADRMSDSRSPSHPLRKSDELSDARPPQIDMESGEDTTSISLPLPVIAKIKRLNQSGRRSMPVTTEDGSDMSLSQSADLQLAQGWIHKMGGAKSRKHYQRRFFTLKGDVLSWRDAEVQGSEDSASVIAVKMALQIDEFVKVRVKSGVDETSVLANDDGFEFTVLVPGHKKLYLKAESFDELRQWTHALSLCGAKVSPKQLTATPQQRDDYQRTVDQHIQRRMVEDAVDLTVDQGLRRKSSDRKVTAEEKAWAARTQQRLKDEHVKQKGRLNNNTHDNNNNNNNNSDHRKRHSFDYTEFREERDAPASNHNSNSNNHNRKEKRVSVVLSGRLSKEEKRKSRRHSEPTQGQGNKNTYEDELDEKDELLYQQMIMAKSKSHHSSTTAAQQVRVSPRGMDKANSAGRAHSPRKTSPRAVTSPVKSGYLSPRDAIRTSPRVTTVEYANTKPKLSPRGNKRAPILQLPFTSKSSSATPEWSLHPPIVGRVQQQGASPVSGRGGQQQQNGVVAGGPLDVVSARISTLIAQIDLLKKKCRAEPHDYRIARDLSDAEHELRELTLRVASAHDDAAESHSVLHVHDSAQTSTSAVGRRRCDMCRERLAQGVVRLSGKEYRCCQSCADSMMHAAENSANASSSAQQPQRSRSQQHLLCDVCHRNTAEVSTQRDGHRLRVCGRCLDQGRAPSRAESMTASVFVPAIQRSKTILFTVNTTAKTVIKSLAPWLAKRGLLVRPSRCAMMWKTARGDQQPLPLGLTLVDCGVGDHSQMILLIPNSGAL